MIQKLKILGVILTMGMTGALTPAMASEPAADVPEVTQNGNFQITGNWQQLRHGWKALSLKVTDQAKHPVVGAQVKVKYEMLEMPMNPPDKAVVEKGDGIYEKSIFIGMGGRWQFDIQVSAGTTTDSLTKIADILN